MNIGLPLVAGTLPFQCYPSTPQALYAAMFSLGSATTTGLTGVIIGPDTPIAQNFDKLWIKTYQGAPVGQFIFSGKIWFWPHASAPSGYELRMWDGTPELLAIYDGGDGGLPGEASGPMWEISSEFAGRIPIAPGLIPGSATTAIVATNYGTAVHTITIAEMPAHHHTYNSYQASTSDGSPQPTLIPTPGPSDLNTGDTGGGTPFEFIPPVRAAYIIRRTGRKYYRG